MKTIEIECKLTVATTKGIHNKKCIFFPVFTGEEQCWHFLNNPGTQNDAPKCPRLLHRQQTMPRIPTS